MPVGRFPQPAPPPSRPTRARRRLRPSRLPSGRIAPSSQPKYRRISTSELVSKWERRSVDPSNINPTKWKGRAAPPGLGPAVFKPTQRNLKSASKPTPRNEWRPKPRRQMKHPPIPSYPPSVSISRATRPITFRKDENTLLQHKYARNSVQPPIKSNNFVAERIASHGPSRFNRTIQKSKQSSPPGLHRVTGVSHQKSVKDVKSFTNRGRNRPLPQRPPQAY